MISPTRTARETSASLKTLIDDLRRTTEAQAREIDILRDQVRLLRAQLYGRRSEKTPPSPDELPRPLPLFDMPEPEDLEREDGERVEVPAHTRRKRGRKPLPEDLPRVEVVHDIDEQDKVCGCGRRLERIGEESSEQLDIVPAKVRVVRHVRPKYACPACEGAEDNGPSVRIAPVPPQIVPKSIAGPGLLAHVLTGSFIQADETSIHVLREPGRSPAQKSYMWIFRRGDPDRPVLIYQYHPTRSGEVDAAFLRDFTGTVQADGYSGYDFLDTMAAVRHIGCWAHARRKFVDVTKALGKNRKAGAADNALSYTRKLYGIEKKARRAGLSPEETRDLCWTEAAAVLDAFEKWLRKKQQTPPLLKSRALSFSRFFMVLLCFPPNTPGSASMAWFFHRFT